MLSLVAGYGALDEWHQSLTPGRHPSVLDLLTDLVGGACCLWIAAYIGRASATEGGLRKRLALGVALCVASATVGVVVA